MKEGPAAAKLVRAVLGVRAVHAAALGAVLLGGCAAEEGSHVEAYREADEQHVRQALAFLDRGECDESLKELQKILSFDAALVVRYKAAAYACKASINLFDLVAVISDLKDDEDATDSAKISKVVEALPIASDANLAALYESQAVLKDFIRRHGEIPELEATLMVFESIYLLLLLKDLFVDAELQISAGVRPGTIFRDGIPTVVDAIYQVRNLYERLPLVPERIRKKLEKFLKHLAFNLPSGRTVNLSDDLMQQWRGMLPSDAAR